MNCPVCGRPVALARPACMYCGAPLPEDVRGEAEQAAKRVKQARNLAGLEAAAAGLAQGRRRYFVVDLSGDIPAETIARACNVSAWEAHQWQAASRYRLVRITDEPSPGPTETALKESGLAFFTISEEAVARSRRPVPVEAIRSDAAIHATFHEDDERPSVRRVFGAQEISLIVSGPIRREKQREQVRKRDLREIRLEDGWLVHIHLKTQERPLEIDPLRTAFEGPGLASAHMRTIELVRSFSATVPCDEGFKNAVPAMAPAADPESDPLALKREPKGSRREPKIVVLDNSGQFKEYSAWRGQVEAMKRLQSRRATE